MRVYKHKTFARFQRKQRLGDETLCQAVARAEAGLIDADLGSGLIKQRVPRMGQGRSGGFRVLVAFKAGRRAVLLFGFAKNDRDNLEADELVELKSFAAGLLEADDNTIEDLVDREDLKEVNCEQPDE